MDQIKKAIERSKSERLPDMPRSIMRQGAAGAESTTAQDGRTFRMLTADPAVLEHHRIVAHGGGSPLAMGFNLLRTTVTQTMTVRRMKTVLVTSPTAGCGKTVTAINLAMSIARQTPGNTILADLDFRRPEVANYLGVGANADIHAVLKGQTPLDEVLFSLDVSGPRLLFLPARSPIAHPAETLTSPEARNLVGTLRSLAQQSFVIFDMPPMLFADDVIAFMPQIDAVLLVIAAGQTTAQEVENCKRLIPEEKFLGLVLAKSKEKSVHDDYGYY